MVDSRSRAIPSPASSRKRRDVDGKTYTVQYFERAVFELHPENQPPYNVLLSLLGRQASQSRSIRKARPTTTPA